jgi:carbon monoxide dehydrogenase subunit G
VGEAGAIPTGAAFAQAVEDALAGTGVEITEIPLSPGRIHSLLQEAKRSGPRMPTPPTATGRALIIEGAYDFEGSPATVYELLLDPTVLREVMVGTQRLERTGDRYTGEMKVGVGPISAAQFSLDVQLADVVPNTSYTMRVEARGRLGFVSGTAKVALGAKPDGGTAMTYRAALQLGGTIAAVGQRMLDSVSKMMSAQGLKALARLLRERSGGGGS